jgi:glycosyltransferase involved in cell wall biosynthesis
MNNDMKISVIVPCYNQAQFLSETLESVLVQTYINWECIIVNDGSTDNTEAVADLFCKKDSRFIYIYKTNGGLSSARNTGILESTGDYLQFLDSDDLLLPQKFANQINVVKRDSSIDICISRYQLFTNDKNNTFDNPISLLPYNLTLEGLLYSWNVTFIFPPVCYIVKKSFLEKSKVNFNQEVKALEDWIFLVQLALNNAKFYEMGESLALYRRHASNMTNNVPFMTQNMIKSTFIIYKILPNELKTEFIDSIDVFLLHTINGLLGVNQLKLKANSLDYKIGKAILIPYNKTTMLLNRVKRKISKIIKKK